MSDKTNAAISLSDELKELVGTRLMMLRTSRGKGRGEFETLTRGTIQSYELHDPSSFKLGDIVNLAAEYGLSPLEFITFLFDGVEPDSTALSSRVLAEQIQDLSDNNRAFLFAMIRTLSEGDFTIDEPKLAKAPHRKVRRQGDDQAEKKPPKEKESEKEKEEENQGLALSQ